jgi:hypothetical protein
MPDPALDPLTESRRFAYADPPYIGQAQRHYRNHPDYDGEVDHAALIARLESDYDGWALSLSMKSLPQLMKLCPDDVLTMAWVKPMSPPLGDHRMYSWEPVIMRPLRRPRDVIGCHLILSPPSVMYAGVKPGHVIGEKPEGFARWVFNAAGLEPTDELHDLFPGSGAIGRAWDRWRDQLRLAL